MAGLFSIQHLCLLRRSDSTALLIKPETGRRRRVGKTLGMSPHDERHAILYVVAALPLT